MSTKVTILILFQSRVNQSKYNILKIIIKIINNYNNYNFYIMYIIHFNICVSVYYQEQFSKILNKKKIEGA